MDYDLTDLGLTKEPETVEPEAYVPAYDAVNTDPIDKGTYPVKFIDGQFKNEDKKEPIRIGTVKSKKNGQTYLSIEVALEVKDAKVQGKTFEKKRTWARVNTMPESLIFQNVKPGREKANSLMDMLIAGGYKGSLRSNDDYVNGALTLVENESEARARLDKTAYCNPNSKDYAGCEHTIRGEANFNIDNGLRAACPGNHSDESRPILLAKNEVKAFYPATKG